MSYATVTEPRDIQSRPLTMFYCLQNLICKRSYVLDFFHKNKFKELRF